MSFTDTQTRKLRAKLNAKHVKTRKCNGATLSYIEGWHAIAEANRIFGYDAWDRETLSAECVWKEVKQAGCHCACIAKVRITVRAGDTLVVREGSGSGHGKGNSPAEAYDIALKAAETDATKRALATFGNPFGLALYDKDKNGVRKVRSKANGADRLLLQVKNATGIPGPLCTTVEEFTEGLKAALGHVPTVRELFQIWDHNRETVGSIRKLATPKAALADKLAAQFKARAITLGDAPVPAANGSSSGKSKIDKSQLPLAEPKRVRSKEHLRFVARQPCLVCGRSPSQAHHLRFAQPRAMSKKVSDEFTVPLCASHHDAAHRVGDEQSWWMDKGVDPMATARKLWAGRDNNHGRTRAAR